MRKKREKLGTDEMKCGKDRNKLFGFGTRMAPQMR